MNSRRKLKVGDKVMLGILFVVMLQMTIVPIIASNYTDTSYTFDFSKSTCQTTTERIKEDDSSVYMKCSYSESDGDTYDAYVWGYSPSDAREAEVGGPYEFSQGITRYMTNWVYENDYEYAYIRACHTGDGTGYFRGVWSPDSI